jgi:tagatose-1,6-bisphosphate aldolase
MLRRKNQRARTAAVVTTCAMTAASLMLTAPQASARNICYDEVDTVHNRYGAVGASGRASFCYDDATGYFETNTDPNWVKDLVSGDGVAARRVLVYYRPGAAREVTTRATDTVSTSGATSWAWSGYFDYVGAYVCLGYAQPPGSEYCTLLYDTMGYSGQ